MAEYITLPQAKACFRTERNTVGFNERVRELVRECGDALHQMTNRRFDRWRDVVELDAVSVRRGGDVDGRVLFVHHDLNSVVNLVNGDGSSISGSDYVLLPRQTSPAKYAIELRNTALAWLPNSERGGRRAIELTGIFGYGGQWRGTLSIANALNNNATSFDVGANSGLEAGMLLMLDNEFMTTESLTGTTLVVERGVNGTTAAAHLVGSVLYRFEPDAVVQRIIKRMVRWYDALEDNPLYATQQLGDISVPADITAMPSDIQDLITGLVKPLRIRSA